MQIAPLLNKQHFLFKTGGFYQVRQDMTKYAVMFTHIPHMDLMADFRNILLDLYLDECCTTVLYVIHRGLNM